MNKSETKKKIMLRHGLFWGWAIITPTVVMVILDLFDKHTPNNIALFSSFSIMLPFVFCNKFIAGQFDNLKSHGTEK